MISIGNVSRARASAPTAHPSAVPSGKQIAKRIKLIKKGQCRLHSKAHGAQKPKRIGAQRRITGANTISRIM